MTSLIKGKKGMTITELMIASSLSVLFTLGFVSASHALRTQMSKQDYYYDANRASRVALDRFAEDAKEAIGIVATQGAFTTGNSTVILKLPSINAAGDATNIDTQFDYVIYQRNSSNSRLLRTLDVLNGTSVREGGADITDQVVAQNVQSLSFSYAGTALGSVAASSLPGLKYFNAQITAQGTLMGTNLTTEADSDIMFRNNIT